MKSADYSKDLYDYTYECRRNCSAYDDGYEKGRADEKRENEQESYHRGYLDGQSKCSFDNELKIRADEREKVLEDVHKAMANKYHCREYMCEVGMTCVDCLKAYMEDLYSDK